MGIERKLLSAQAAEYTRQSTMESITIPVGPRLGDIVIEAKNLRKSYGDRVLMDNLSFSVPPGSVVGIANCSCQAACNCLDGKACIIMQTPKPSPAQCTGMHLAMYKQAAKQ